jgi:hypothetical protein
MVEPLPGRKLTTTDGLIVAALTGLLFCVYLLTASLTFISDDELYIFDATESLARRGNVLRSETADLAWPGDSEVEPVMPLLTAPVYWLANTFSGIGNAQATLLFNAMITALTAACVYLYVRQLEFEIAVATLSGLMFGLGTIVWPYTKTFFRETLHMATLFATAYCLLRWRDAFTEKSSSTLVWVMLTIIAALLAFFTKESALYALPVLALIFVPSLSFLQRNRAEWIRIGLALLGLAGLVLAGLWLFNTFFYSNRFEVWRRLEQMAGNLSLAQAGILGFVFSPGKSIFLFSPPILLALAAPFSDKQRRWDASWPLILSGVSILVYALVRGSLWWGGTNWGPRYLMPMTPFLIVAAAPAVKYCLAPKSWLPKIGLAVLFGLGVVIQIGAVTIRLGDYYNAISQVQPAAPWTIGLWDPYYSALLTNWRLILSGNSQYDFAWLRALPTGPVWLVPLLIGPLVVAFAIAIWYGLTRPDTQLLKRRLLFGVALTGFLMTGLFTWLSLHALYYDQRYNGQDENLHQLLSAIDQAAATAPDPVIFLNNRTYFTFMLNYYKGSLEWYTLPLNPNELRQPGQAPLNPATDPYTLINKDATGQRIADVVDCFGRLHTNYDPICTNRDHPSAFLIMEFGPFTPSAIRPMEWWLSRNFYYKGVSEFGPTVRLVEFSTNITAPADEQPAAQATQYHLGDKIVLTGWDVDPADTRLRPGTVLNVSTRWEAVAAPEADYKIGMYLISPEGSVVAQDDSYPVNGFWPTSTWQVGKAIRHNIALTLPANLPPGFYEVWTLMYSPADNARLPVQDINGTTIVDHIVLFTVEVTR